MLTQIDPSPTTEPTPPSHLAETDLAARALHALGTALLICDAAKPDSPVLYANLAFEAVTGYTPEEALGRDPRFLQGEDTDPRAVAEIAAALKAGRPVRAAVLNYRRDGGTFWNDMDVAPVHDNMGRLTHFVGVQSDISERVLAQEAARAATTRLEVLIASIQAGVIVEDDGGQIVLANTAFCEMMGIDGPSEALVGANMVPRVRGTSLLFADPDAFLARTLELRRARLPVQAEELRLTDGRVWERDYVPVLAGADGGGYGGHLWLFRDVTERRLIERQARDATLVLEAQKAELEKANADLERTNTELGHANAQLETAIVELGRANVRLDELATTDGLTGLLNQRVFSDRLSEEFRRARRYSEPLSLIVLDVDRFKAYNDTFGHLVGNEVLQGLAEVIREHARETDLAARFGGEEFAIILPHTDVAEAAALAERLRATLDRTAWSNPHPITASFGVCALTPEIGSPDDLVACADAAMYRAKAGGRNRVERG